MAKYKYILTIIITLCTITTFAQPAQYTPMTAAGYQMKRLKVDSTLHLPSFCGVPTIRGSVAKEGALAIDTCGGLLYMWTRAAGWDTVNTSGGGGSSTDTTSLSNRINKKIDSLKRSNDSVFAWINGTRYFQFKDSVGGGGTTPNLQQVTTAGSTTTNTIIVGNISSSYIGIGPNQFAVVNGVESISLTSNRIASTNGFGTIDNFDLPTNIPSNLATIPISVNGIKANANGNITISTGGVAVDTIFRTLGKDSIFYKKNNITYAIKDSVGGVGSADTIYTQNPIMFIRRNDSNIVFFNADTANLYRKTTDTTNKFVNRLERTTGKDSIIYFVGANRFAIKDSVGTNPAPVGYYGAFSDSTTQTAALINTAYGVKLGVTELSNGVTISNNTRIKIANAGIYNIQFSLQLEKIGGSGNMIADIWLRKNGVNLQGTTGKIVLTGSANASPVVAAWNYVIAVASGDSLELMWATSNDNVVIKATAATSPHPSIPSAILTVTQQSGIMAGTGISPLDTANMLLPYLRKTDTASLSNRINTKLNATDTASLSNRINQTPTLTGYQLLGSNIKSFPLGITGFANTTGTLAHVSSRMYLVAFYIPQTTTITGAKWILTSTGTSYAGGANYNGLVLYSYNIATGLATRIDSTASDANTWATAIGTQSKAFVTPISLSPGIYYLGAMCNGTATTFPSIAQNTQTNGATTYDLASPARLTGAITGTVSAASFNLSTATANTNYPILMLY